VTGWADSFIYDLSLNAAKRHCSCFYLWGWLEWIWQEWPAEHRAYPRFQIIISAHSAFAGLLYNLAYQAHALRFYKLLNFIVGCQIINRTIYFLDQGSARQSPAARLFYAASLNPLVNQTLTILCQAINALAYGGE
jgi:hypothetical protein